ncbi:hypothetical protein JQ629_09150 [Bradyrhizobium sp. AUGA SZCCT0222]|uniref:hypothetical protein n=1 Tax=Bradyrhizobium sp. AUGA SZCCT0222 TaxID=2807668 RepID=UPI001BAA2337|nr:hypothetical protein [Bradyrhizobium sp. AUGA SZCCT0222]MBR1267672.1 hypothetical protein [Bradyrhizobium sp. AUGA SZCCT0222]
MNEMPIAAIKGRALPIALPPPFGPYRLLIAELGQTGKVYYFSELWKSHHDEEFPPQHVHPVVQRRLRLEACPRNEAKHDLPQAKLQNPWDSPTAEVAATVRTLAIMLDFRRRNYGPRAVLADFASNPITVFNPRFCRRTVLVAATWHGAFVWHHPGGIKPLMDGLIVRWMMMLLRYGRAGGENEAAPGHTGNRARNTGGAIRASHGGLLRTRAIDASEL